MTKGKLLSLSVREWGDGYGVFEKGGTKPVATGCKTMLRNHVRSVREQEQEN